MMMKKIYQTPETVSVFVKLQQMVAASKIEDGFKTEDIVETEETSGNLSRRRNVWDDELDEMDDTDY